MEWISALSQGMLYKRDPSLLIAIDCLRRVRCSEVFALVVAAMVVASGVTILERRNNIYIYIYNIMALSADRLGLSAEQLNH